MKIWILFFLLACLLSSVSRASGHLKPFLTDLCTSYPEGTRDEPNLWAHCCMEHDLYFWAGGSLEDRKEADLRLRSCVEATGERTQAALMYLAVSLGARSPIRFSTKQWGNAWEDRERYLSLTEQETALILQHIESHNQDLPLKLQQSFKEQLNSRLDSK